MRLNLKSLSLAMLFVTGLQAQNNSQERLPNRGCGTQVPPAEWDAWFNQKVEEYKQGLTSAKTQSTTYTIPVIVHVIYGSTNTAVGSYPNISQAQVNSQITVLNNDFAGMGLNVGNLAATAFSAVGAADCSISFCLAQLDPSGNFLTEPGIDRVSYVANGWNNPASASYNTSTTFQNYFNSTIKPATIWDPTRYFNIWVSDVNSGAQLLGYATFPINTGLSGITGSGGANTDGVWVWAKAFGNTGSVQAPYHLGRTATHEVGHWVGLRHIGGDGNGNQSGDCNATDYCADTPPQKGGYMGGAYGQNFGSPTYPLYATGPNSCASAPNGCMFMNFMDYVDDPACYMFTPDQSARMNTAMINGTYRKYLTASSATMCGLAATLPQAVFTITNTTCEGGTVEVTNQSTGTPPPSYIWSVLPNAAGVSYNPNNAAPNPTITFALVGNYTVVVNATNAAGTTTYSRPVDVVECNSGVGIAKMSAFQNSVNMAPNPTSGFVEISTSMPGIQHVKIELHNYLGQVLTTTSYNPSSTPKYILDLSGYSNGVYFVTLQSGADKAVKRLIVNK